ncbi:MAG: sensor histidine kinase [Clostridia bacterium]|nr:sensor histidine kinase [Clostridia bacterium]
MTIKRKMTLIVSMMLMMIVLLSIVFIYNKSSEILVEEAEDYMAAQLDRANENVALLLKTIVLETERLSLEDKVVNYFNGSFSQVDSDRYLTDLMALKNEEELLYFDLFLMNHDGIIVSAAMAEAVGVDVGSRAYFQKALREGVTNTSDIILSRADNTQIVITIAPTYDGAGRTVGYTGVAIYATYFSNFLNNFNVTKSNDYIIIDSYDNIVSHPDKRKISSRFDYFGFDKSRIASNSTIVYDGETYRILQKDLGFNDWRILSYIKYDDIYAKSMELAYDFMMLSIVAIVLAIIFGVYLTDFISKPIVSMTESINRLLEDEERFQHLMVRQLPFDAPISDMEIAEINVEPTEVNNLRKAILGFQSALQEGAKSFDLEHEKLKHYIDRLYRELEMINRRNLDFIATLSHDLRTPLTLIKGYARGLESGEIKDEAMREKFQTGIVKGVDDIEHLIYNVLDFAYEVDHMTAFDFKSYDVVSFLEALRFDLTHLYEDSDKEVQLDISWESDLKKRVWVDQMNILRVITNLLNNSVKYTKQGDLITLRIHAGDDDLWVEVYDEGMGIRSEELAHIYELFYRTQESKEIKGYGLGLYISQQILKAHHASLKCESVFGTYTRMTFKLLLSE